MIQIKSYKPYTFQSETIKNATIAIKTMNSKDYKFIFDAHNNPDVYYAVDKDNFESIPIADTYDRYGQRIGHDGAGDVLTLLTKTAVDYANGFLDNVVVYVEGDIIYAYKNYDMFCDIINEVENETDIQLYQETVLAYNYYDGHNWQTVVLDGENPTHEEVTDVKMLKYFRTALSKMQFMENSGGYSHYEFGKLSIKKSYWRNSFANYDLEYK